MKLNEEIIRFLEYGNINSRYRLNSVNEECYVIYMYDRFGIAIPMISSKKIYEDFNKIEFKTIYLEGLENQLLVLLADKDVDIEDFSLICLDLINEYIKDVQTFNNDPLEWWRKWRDLLGDRKHEKKPYSLLSELISYYHVLKEDQTAIWSAGHNGTHDIETENFSVEVKSSLKKYKTHISISSQFQLAKPDKPLYLFFVRLEESMDGISVNQMLEKFDFNTKLNLKSKIQKMGLKLENHVYDKSYKVLEIRKYVVNDDFPVFDLSKYTDERFKQHMIKFRYTIDIDSIEYDEIKMGYLENKYHQSKLEKDIK